MNKNKPSLIKNTFIFTISNFSSKLLVFLMLPLYTNVLSTDEYGKADLVIAVTTFLLPILTASIADATLRFGMEYKKDSKKVFSLSLGVCTCGIMLLLVITPIIKRVLYFEISLIFIILIGIFSFYSGMFSMMARALDRVSIVGIAGIVSTFITVISNIILLVVFKIGLTGYLVSTILTYFSSCVVLFIGCRMYKLISLKEIIHPDFMLLKEMLIYSIPLIPKSSCWWLIDTANKYILGLKSSTQDVGIYSAAIKIPTILTTMQGFFSQAWILSAIDATESSNKEEYYSKYYAYYSTLLFFLSSSLILVCQFLAHILYSKEFQSAAEIVPILIISTFFGGLIGFTSSIFSAIKRTKTVLFATSLGAIVSVILDFILIPSLGVIGAAISNAVAYFLIWIIGIILLNRYVSLTIVWNRFFIRIAILLLQSVVFFFMEQGILFYSVQLLCVLLTMIFSYKELYLITKSVFTSVKLRVLH